MKLRCTLRGIVIVLFVLNGYSQQNSKNRLPQDLDKQINQLVKQYQDLDIFSGVVLVAVNAKPVYHKAFGYADREKKIENTINTKFDVGSMNKTFTQLIILKLLEEGKLNLTDNIGKFIEGIDSIAAKNASINDLLNHTSGYGDYLTQEYDNLPTEMKNFRNTLKMVKKMPLEYEPGSEQMYSNIGYLLLGAVIEFVTGKSYFENVEELIIKPLQLNSTSMEPKKKVTDMAIGYFRTVDDKLVSNDNFIEYPKPDGGFRSTALDIVKFYNEFHYGDTVVGMDTKMQDEFFKAIHPHANSGAAIPHAGGYPGANTVKFEILRDRITIVVFANMNEPVAEKLGTGILAIVRGQEPEQPSYPAIPNIYKHYEKFGLDYIKENFEALTTNFHPTDPRGIILNNVGYFYLNEKNDVEKAIEIFELNTTLFGKVDPNVWDSLGESYYMSGLYEKAMNSYKKALSIDPNFASSKRMIQKIEQQN